VTRGARGDRRPRAEAARAERLHHRRGPLDPLMMGRGLAPPAAGDGSAAERPGRAGDRR